MSFMKDRTREDIGSRKENALAGKAGQRRNTAVLILSLMAVFLAASAIRYLLRPGAAAKDSALLKAVIQIDGKEVCSLDLDKNTEYRAETKDGHYNVIVVEDHSVLVREADCSNQICVRTGRIRNPGEVIACLPHRMIVYLSEGD
jgi:hypothetical protein